MASRSMANKYPWHLPSRSAVAVFLAITACFVWPWARNRPIPFDADRWKQAEISHDFGIRNRMAYNLRAKLESMEPPNFVDVQLLLGSPLRPPQPFSDRSEAFLVKYRLGQSYRGPIHSKSWYLKLYFDGNEQLLRVSIVPSSS